MKLLTMMFSVDFKAKLNHLQIFIEFFDEIITKGFYLENGSNSKQTQIKYYDYVLIHLEHKY